MNTEHYKATSERTDADERALIPAFKRTRQYATMSLNGERVEIIGKDSSDDSRVLVLSSRGLTSYVNADDLIQ